jgi:polyferredoxin/tetratricopeptide (TPR) repeat protein
MGKWRAAVLIAVHLIIALHIAHWLTTGSTVTPVEPSEAMAFSRASIVNAGLIFFAATILLTAIFGRFFCGWACHVVALQDLCRWMMLKVGITPRPLKSRLLLWVPVLAFVYMFLWPLAYRIYIGDSLAVRGSEMTTSHFWATFPGWVVGGLTFLVCGFACVYFLGAKGFCTYACPYGAMFAAVDKLAPMRIRVTDACESCGHCTAVCSSNVRVHEEVRDWGMVVSPGCMKCGDCVSVCPKDALYYGTGPIPWLAKPTARGQAHSQAHSQTADPSKRPPAKIEWADEALLAAVFALSFVIVRGLYGVIPFLMSLGVGAVMAFFALTTWRLFRRQDIDRSGLRLKRDGRLLPWGRVFLGAMVLLAAFFAHGAFLQLQALPADKAWERSALVRRDFHASPEISPGVPDWARGEAKEAIPHLLAIEKWGLFPTLGNAAKLASFYALTGAIAEMEKEARRAIERDELPGEMHQLLARAALARAEPAAAAAEWEKAIAARPESPEPYLALGIYLARNGDISAGQQVFDRGLGATAESPQLFYNAALSRALTGRTEESLPLFERALALQPHYREARENLAGALASLGRFEASVAHYRLAVEQAPGDVATRVLMARALLGLGPAGAGEAVEQLRQALAIDPGNEEARLLFEQLGGS